MVRAIRNHAKCAPPNGSSSPRTILSSIPSFHEYWHILELLYRHCRCIDRLSLVPFDSLMFLFFEERHPRDSVARIFLQPRRFRVSLAKIPFIGCFGTIICWSAYEISIFRRSLSNEQHGDCSILSRNTLAEPDFSSVRVLSRAKPRYLHSLRDGYQLPWVHAFARMRVCVSHG